MKFRDALFVIASVATFSPISISDQPSGALWEELPLLRGRDGRRGVRDDGGGDTDRAQERIDTLALPRAAFRVLRKASGRTPRAVVRRRAGLLQGAGQVTDFGVISSTMAEMAGKNIRYLLYRGIIY